MDYERAGLSRDLELEREAHQETQRALRRAVNAGMFWKAEVERVRGGPPNPMPMPTPDPIPLLLVGDGVGVCGGGDGGGVMGLLVATMGGLASLGELLMADSATTPPPDTRPLMMVIRARLTRLARAVNAAPGAPGEPTAAPMRRGDRAQGGYPTPQCAVPSQSCAT